MSSPTTWPEDVIARYLTTGGATVDIRAIDHSTSHAANCGGCEHEQMLTGLHLDKFYTDESITEQTRQDARRWAQAHAETCRAIPKPVA